jgi:hypothetical protein
LQGRLFLFIQIVVVQYTHRLHGSSEAV